MSDAITVQNFDLPATTIEQARVQILAVLWLELTRCERDRVCLGSADDGGVRAVAELIAAKLVEDTLVDGKIWLSLTDAGVKLARWLDKVAYLEEHDG